MAKNKPEAKQPGPDDVDPQAPLGPAAAGARAARRSTSRSASISAACTTTASRARARRSRTPASARCSVRPAQHPLHHQHGDRRVGARQAHALLAAHRQRRAVHLGFRQRRAPPQALRAVAAATTTAAPACSACAARSARDLTLFKEAAKEIKSILEGRGRGEHAARRRRGRAADAVRAAEDQISKCATGSRRCCRRAR